MKKYIIVVIVNLIFGSILSAQEKPNIVVFLVDDLRPELGSYGNHLVKSPNIDSLAKEGVQFQNAYAQQAICAPSRMSILTGLRPEKIGIYSIFTPLRKKHKDMVTLPQFFKENGYKTVSIGKVYHHAIDDKESWNIHVPKEKNSWVAPENLALLKSGKNKAAAFECIDVEDEAYKDGRTANHAIEILKQIKNDKFLMFVGLSKPHLPFNAPKKYWDLYNKENFIVPNKTAPKDIFRMSLTKWGELRGYHGIPKEGVLDDSLSKDLIHGYYASISYIDAQIGKVMKTLDELDLRKNTMIVFMSDHGWKLGEYGAWCKHTNFELDVNVPLIISRETGYKNRVTNEKSDALVENVDLFPTIAEACGFKTHLLDGNSLLSLVDNPKKEWEKGAFSLYGRGKNIMGFTCTDGEYRYTEWWSNKDRKVMSNELFLNKQDYTKQTINLVKDANYKKEVVRMEALLNTQFPKNSRSTYPQNDK